MRELRSFIERLRDELGVPYPLAHARPFVGTGRRLLMAAQEAAELGADWSLVAVANRQLGLTPASDAFYRRVVWSGDEAGAWRPHDDPNSPVGVLVGDEAIGTWAQLEVIMTQWRRIEALQAGPYIYTASRTSWRRAL